MRKLNLSLQPIDPARALPLLRQLAAARPLGVAADHEEQWLRFIVSIATQYWRGNEEVWALLLWAGHEALADCYNCYAEKRAAFTGTAEQYEGAYSPDRYGSWWVRQRIIAAAKEYRREEGAGFGVACGRKFFHFFTSH